ncbi:MAG: response regulator [Elusimicrobiota bacterium]
MENVDIIIIDDDPMSGELTKDLLTDDGWKVLLIDESLKAIEEIKRIKPKLVITDIMMPGINGMEICKRIKSMAETKSIKVIILSGKSYESEKQRAFALGADYFIAKPYNVETFSKTIKEIIENNSQSKVTPPPPPSKQKESAEDPTFNPEIDEKQVRISAYGIRSLGKKIETSESKYGRQTLSVSIETKNDIIILDAGTGLYELGMDIINNKKYYKTIWLFLTHFHLDNIIGLPHFLPFLDSSYTINILGPNDPEKSLKEIIKSNLYSSFSPIPSPPKAKINLYEILEENYEISSDIKMATMYSNHPTTTMIYLFNIKGFKLAYAPDSEIWEQSTAFQDYNERLGKFTSNFDLLIHDCYYDDEDYQNYHHKGHSSISVLLRFAIRNKIKNLIPININSDYDDNRIDKMLLTGENILKTSGAATKLTILKEKESAVFNISGT